MFPRNCLFSSQMLKQRFRNAKVLYLHIFVSKSWNKFACLEIWGWKIFSDPQFEFEEIFLPFLFISRTCLAISRRKKEKKIIRLVSRDFKWIFSSENSVGGKKLWSLALSRPCDNSSNNIFFRASALKKNLIFVLLNDRFRSTAMTSSIESSSVLKNLSGNIASLWRERAIVLQYYSTTL